MILQNYKHGKKVRIIDAKDKTICADGKMYVCRNTLFIIRKSQYTVTFPITYIGVVPFIYGFYIEDYFFFQSNMYVKSFTDNLPF